MKCSYFVFKSRCLRKPGRAKRWGLADLKDILVMQSLSHMNTNGRGLRNFKSFLSENDYAPSFLTLMRPQTILIKVNFERLKLIISLRYLDGNFLANLSVYSLMLWYKNILLFSRNSFFIWPQKNSTQLIISLRYLDGNFLANFSVYSLMLWCKNILLFSRNSFFFGLRKMSIYTNF